MNDSSDQSGCLGIFLRLLKIQRTDGADLKDKSYPFGVRDVFLSPAEISFFHVLKGILPPGRYLITKVRLGDLFYVKQPHRNQAARNRIDRRHVDFVVCDAATMQPLLGIELDDSSHRRKDSEESDRLKDGAFAAAGLPLLRVTAARGYEPREIAGRIEEKISGMKIDE